MVSDILFFYMEIHFFKHCSLKDFGFSIELLWYPCLKTFERTGLFANKTQSARGSPWFCSSTTVPLHLCGRGGSLGVGRKVLSAFSLSPMIDHHYIALGRRLRVLVKFMSGHNQTGAISVCLRGSFSAVLPHPSQTAAISYSVESLSVGGCSVLMLCPQATIGRDTCTWEGSLSSALLPDSLVSTPGSPVLRAWKGVQIALRAGHSGFPNS